MNSKTTLIRAKNLMINPLTSERDIIMLAGLINQYVDFTDEIKYIDFDENLTNIKSKMLKNIDFNCDKVESSFQKRLSFR